MYDDDFDPAADPFADRLAGLPDRLVDALSWLRTQVISHPTAEGRAHAATILAELGLLAASPGPADDEFRDW